MFSENPRNELESLADIYRVMVEKSPYGIFMVDRDDRCIYVNEEGCSLSGCAAEELLGQDLLGLLPEDLRAAGGEHFNDARRVPVSHAELPFHRRDGQQCRWSISSVPLGDGRFVGYAIDITENRGLRLELEREKTRLSRAGELARVGWWEIDLKSGLVVASDPAHDIYGVPKGGELTLAEVQKQPLPEYRTYLDAALKDLIDGVRPYDVTYRIERLCDGKLIDIHSIAEFDAKSKRVFGTLQDITAWKQAELALRQSEARLRAIFDSASDFIYLKDRDGRYTHANRACCNFFQRSLDEIVGRRDTDIFSPQYIDEINAIDQHVMDGHVHRGITERSLHGLEVVLETIKVPIFADAGEVIGLCGISRDITDVRKLEEQLRQAQKMEAIGRLAGGVAHDFNNLLTPILGFSELLLQVHEEGHPHHRDLAAIARAAGRARDLTAQLLAFGRKQVLDVQVVDLNQVIRESEAMLRRLLRENIRLDLVLAPVLGSVSADVSQLNNALINLVINAADALPDGGVIRIETRNIEIDEAHALAHPGSRPGPHVLLEVGDDGCGMDHETLDMIFEPFFTTKEIYAGTGLGLSTVDGIVKQHQGSIDVDSLLGHGSVFRVYLPRVEAEAEPLPDPDTSPQLHGKERILIVEDDAAVRNLASRALSRYGYAVVPVPDPTAALKEVQAGLEPCRLLLSDVVMPGLNGVQLHRALQEVWPGVPVLFMSGYTSNVVVNHGILAEGLHFIQKPFTPKDLAAKIREVLDS